MSRFTLTTRARRAIQDARPATRFSPQTTKTTKTSPRLRRPNRR